MESVSEQLHLGGAMLCLGLLGLRAHSERWRLLGMPTSAWEDEGKKKQSQKTQILVCVDSIWAMPPGSKINSAVIVGTLLPVPIKERIRQTRVSLRPAVSLQCNRLFSVCRTRGFQSPHGGNWDPGGLCHSASAAAGWTAGGEHLLGKSLSPWGNSHGNLGRSWRTRHLSPGRITVLGSSECGGPRPLPAHCHIRVTRCMPKDVSSEE